MEKSYKILKSIFSILLFLQGLYLISDKKVEATAANYIDGALSVKTWSNEAGDYPSTLILLNDKRTILSSGYNFYGILGRGNTPDSNINRETKLGVSDTSEVLGEIESMSVSETNSILLDSYGDVYLAGRTDLYAKGDGTTTVIETLRNREVTLTWSRKFMRLNLEPLGGAKVVQAVAGYGSVILLAENGDVWVTGYNPYGQLGVEAGDFVRRFTRVFSGAKEIVAGQGVLALSTWIITTEGKVMASGYNGTGVFNTGDFASRRQFSQVETPTPTKAGVKQIVVGDRHVNILMEDGTLFTGGGNLYGTMGVGPSRPSGQLFTTYSNVTNEIKFPQPIKRLFTGVRSSWLELEDGTLWATGTNSDQNLGYKFERDSVPYGENTYHQVSNPERLVENNTYAGRNVIIKSEGVDNPIDVMASALGTLLIDANGRLKIVGRSYYQQIGPKSSNEFDSIDVDRFIYNPRIQFFNGKKEDENRIIVDPTSMKLGLGKVDVNQGAPEVELIYELRRDGSLNPFRTRTVSLKDGPVEVTMADLTLFPGNYTITSYRKTATGPRLESTPIERRFTLSVNYGKPGIDTENKFILVGTEFNPRDDVYALNDDLIDITTEVTVVENNVDTQKIGSYNVTYSITNQGLLEGTTVKKSIRVTVIDQFTSYDENTAIRSEPWTIKLNDYQEYTSEELIALAKVYAWDVTSNSEISPTVSSNEIKRAPGPYFVTFSGNSVISQTHINIIDEKTTEDRDTGFLLEDFTIDISEFTTAGTVADDTLIRNAKGKAWSLSEGSQLNQVIVNKANISSKLGVYQVQIGAESLAKDEAGKSLYTTVKTAKVSVIDTNTTYDSQTLLQAVPFSIRTSEAAELLEDTVVANEQLKIKANVKAWDRLAGQMLDSADIVIRENEIKAEEGLYSVTYALKNSVTGQQLLNKVAVIVTDKDTKEFISAQGFVIGSDEVKGANFVKLAKAKAYDITNPDKILEIPLQLKGEKPTAKGLHPLTFTTKRGEKKEVNVLIINSPVTEQNEQLYANDFEIALVDIETADFVKLAQAAAWDISNNQNPQAVPLFLSSEKPTDLGRYQITFKTAANTMITVTVTVKTEVVIDQKTQEIISANDFTMDLEAAKGANKELLIAASQATARTFLGQLVDIKSAIIEGDVLEAGRYKVIIKTEKGTLATVTATITEQQPDQEIIEATDFYISLATAENIDKKQAIILAKAEAKMINSGKEVEITTVEGLEGLSEEGIKPLVFSTSRGTKKKINVYISTELVTDDKMGELIAANNFTISYESAKGATSQDLIAKAKAKALKIEDNSELSILDITPLTAIVQGGQYPITFKTAKGTEITVTATVEQRIPKYLLEANDIIMDISEVAKAENVAQLILEKSAAKVTNRETAEVITGIEIQNLEQVLIKEGKYILTLTFSEPEMKSRMFNGIYSKEISVTITHKLPELTVATILASDTPIISGTATAGVIVAITIPDQTTIEVIAKDGNWLVRPSASLNPGDIVRAVATDQFGGQSAKLELIVQASENEETTKVPPTEQPPGGTLPVTGQNNDVILLASALLMILSALALVLIRKKKGRIILKK
ncbi:MAG: immunoglobulin-like domain-containing protein [Culicoidibacterales bacterium]